MQQYRARSIRTEAEHIEIVVRDCNVSAWRLFEHSGDHWEFSQDYATHEQALLAAALLDAMFSGHPSGVFQLPAQDLPTGEQARTLAQLAKDFASADA